MTDPTIITLSGIVVVAYVRHPLRFYEYRLYSLVAFFSYALPGLSVITVDGWDCHRFISRCRPMSSTPEVKRWCCTARSAGAAGYGSDLSDAAAVPYCRLCRFLN
jgi:hypothetical protein